MVELYQHEPLKSDRSIRLFRLYPSLRGSELSGELIEVSLDKAPTYEALSYVWGSPEPARYIRCHDKSISVTSNCEAALLHLQRQFWGRLIWVDSICIDQSSNADKSQQVKMMAEIYGKATQAVVWLGEGDETTDRAVKRLRLMEENMIIQQYHNYEGLLYRPLYYSFKARNFVRGMFEKLAFIAISSLFQSVWLKFFRKPIDISIQTLSIYRYAVLMQ